MAGGTPLHAHLDALHLHVLVQRGTEVVILVLVLIGCDGERKWDDGMGVGDGFLDRLLMTELGKQGGHPRARRPQVLSIDYRL